MNIDGNSEYVLLKINNDLAFGYVNGCQLVKGGIGTAGELSHLRLNVNGDLCKCGGRGCLESISDEKERWNVLKDLLPGLTKKYNDSKVYLWSEIKQEDLEGASVSLINPSVSEILTGNGHAAAIQFIERRIS
jgi:predicted NBD/HSP70 family sugar kinase